MEMREEEKRKIKIIQNLHQQKTIVIVNIP